MLYEQLGNTGVFVSRLCLGTMTFGGATDSFWKNIGGTRQDEANRIVSTAIDAGINFFDSANIYAFGESETILGKALGSRRRDVLIATKLHGRVGPGPNQVGQSRLHIMQSLEDSLKRLGTDYIDLYQIHMYDPLTPFEESLKALDDAVRQGKVRYIGCSNLTAWQIMKSRGVSALKNLAHFVSVQSYYSVVGRDIEREIVPLLHDQKMGLMTWSPLAGGLLSGKYTRENAPKDESRRKHFDFPPVEMDYAYDVIEVLSAVAARHNSNVAQVALAWQLHQPFVTSVIIGARKMPHLEENIKSIHLTLSARDLNEIDAVSRLPSEYPAWMQKMLNADRTPGQLAEANSGGKDSK